MLLSRLKCGFGGTGGAGGGGGGGATCGGEHCVCVCVCPPVELLLETR